jgi:CHAD domain-containing protein
MTRPRTEEELRQQQVVEAVAPPEREGSAMTRQRTEEEAIPEEAQRGRETVELYTKTWGPSVKAFLAHVDQQADELLELRKQKAARPTLSPEARRGQGLVRDLVYATVSTSAEGYADIRAFLDAVAPEAGEK